MRVILSRFLLLSIFSLTACQHTPTDVAHLNQGHTTYDSEHIIAASEYEQGIALLNEQDFAYTDLSKAVKLIQSAAERGYHLAEFKLAVMYLRGIGVDQDEQQARQWMMRAAHQGYPSAQYMMGYMYENGLDVIQDQELSMYWYARAKEDTPTL